MSFSGKEEEGNDEALLECGSSLAEREHCEERLPPRVFHNSSSNPLPPELDASYDPHFRRNQVNNNIAAARSLEDPVSIPGLPGATALRSSFIRADECPRSSVESLRNLLASDVLTAPTFASPFLAKKNHQGGASLGNSNNREHHILPLVYCDQTASNRPLQSIESYLHHVCLPLYGNTHTTTSITGSQSTALVAEARQIVAEETNAKITGKASLDVVLFAGNGATSAVELLIDCLGLRHACSGSSLDTRPVVFVGPYEHHSNLLPWRESGSEVVSIRECPQTHQVDLIHLEQQLRNPRFDNRLKLGTFAAASNVTGQLSNVNAIAACLHRHNALAFFDYATAAPYTELNMNPPPDPLYPLPHLVAKDAVFISPHKCLGGVGTPGILIVKKHLVSQSNAPSRSGGGTVFYVTHDHHRFLGNRLERYEGGTPNIMGIVRVGLTFLLKRRANEAYQRARMAEQVIAKDAKKSDAMPPSIEEYDYETYRQVSTYLKQKAPNLVLLGWDDGIHSKKLPIFSFLIQWGKRFLHYNYVCAILNDVFGIQSRGGCQCAGPYSQHLLGLTARGENGCEGPNQHNRDIEHALVKFKERAELLRPGYTRLSLPFKGLTIDEVEYVKNALVWVSHHAWELVCQYRCNHRTGEWRHMSRQGRPLGRSERRWLGYYDFESGPPKLDQFETRDSTTNIPALLKQALDNAEDILRAAREDRVSITQALKTSEAEAVLGNDDSLEELRWYVYPQECALVMSQGECQPALEPPVGALDPSRRMNDNVHGVPLSSNGCATSTTCSEPLGLSCSLFTAPKKATRDSSTWGTGQAVAQAIGAAPVINVESALSFSQQRIHNASPSTSHTAGKKHRHMKPPQKIMRLCIQAIYQWNMLEDGDRLLLGLSGGKDSLSLLHVLLEVKRRLPIKFEVEVCTVDPMTPSFDPSPLIPYVESLGLKYHYVRDDIVARAGSSGKDGQEVSSLCSFCARMKRGKLYTIARENKCNKLILAQHLDDCAESFLMSVMHNGFLKTMKANYPVNAGDLRVIRPLVYCRERLMTDFAKSASLPVINENCPACFEEPKERARVKKLLSREEALYPNIFDNIRRSLLPVMHADSSSILRSYLDEILAKSKGEIDKKRKRESDNGIHEPVSTSSEVVNAGSDETAITLQCASEEDLLRELARRKADKYRLTGASKFVEGAPSSDMVTYCSP